MKATLLFAAVAMALAGSKVLAASELEALREKCARQEQEIRRLEALVRPQQANTTVSITSTTANPLSYTVRKGDSLERIARRNGTSVTTLAKINGIRTSKAIHPGQKLKLPGKPAVSGNAVAATTPKSSAAPAVRTSASGSHKVAAGETFYSISRKHRISVNELLAANPEVKPTELREGQTIRLGGPAPQPATQAVARQETPAKPISQPQVASKPRPAALPANVTPVSTISAQKSAPVVIEDTAPTQPAQAPQPALQQSQATPSPAPAPVAESSPTPNTEKKIRSVTIEGEMTYGEFAAKHGTDPDRLNDLNGLDLTHATVLAKGSELYVPAQP